MNPTSNHQNLISVNSPMIFFLMKLNYQPNKKLLLLKNKLQLITKLNLLLTKLKENSLFNNLLFSKKDTLMKFKNTMMLKILFIVLLKPSEMLTVTAGNLSLKSNPRLVLLLKSLVKSPLNYLQSINFSSNQLFKFFLKLNNHQSKMLSRPSLNYFLTLILLSQTLPTSTLTSRITSKLQSLN